MVTYADVPLAAMTEDLLAHLQEWWAPECDEFFRPPGLAKGKLENLPFPRINDLEGPPRIGVLNWPAMASRWATFFAIVRGEQLTQIRDVLAANDWVGQLVLKNTDADTSPIVDVAMHMLPPRPISYSEAADGTSAHKETCWLLALVDSRFFAWGMCDGVADAENIGPSGTWDDFLEEIASLIVQDTTTVDTVPSEYGDPSADRWGGMVGMPYPLIVDAACAAVQGVFTAPIGGGNSRIWRPGAAATQQATQWGTTKKRLLVGGLMDLELIQQVVPDTVSVVFDGGTPVREDVGTSGLLESRPATIFGELSADEDPADLEDYADQVAADWYAWRVAGLVDATFNGLIAWEPTGAEQSVEFDTGLASGVMVTRVRPWPVGNWNVYGVRETATPAGSGVYIKITNAAMVSKGHPTGDYVAEGVLTVYHGPGTEWVDDATTVYIKPTSSDSDTDVTPVFSLGGRYRADLVGTFPTSGSGSGDPADFYVATSDAQEIEEVCFPGLMGTGDQTFDGEKTWRDSAMYQLLGDDAGIFIQPSEPMVEVFQGGTADIARLRPKSLMLDSNVVIDTGTITTGDMNGFTSFGSPGCYMVGACASPEFWVNTTGTTVEKGISGSVTVVIGPTLGDTATLVFTKGILTAIT